MFIVHNRFTILNSVLVTKNSDLQELVDSESRVMLLYCTREEALRILQAARVFKITGENYVWVVTQSVMENLQAPQLFPVGMLGKFKLFFDFNNLFYIIDEENFKQSKRNLCNFLG